MSDITEEMKAETKSFAGYMERMNERVLKAEQEASKTQLHPGLTIDSMESEMKNNAMRDPRKGRDFFNQTKNEETLHAFNTTLNTSEMRDKYKNYQDPTAQWKVQSASDIAYRTMKLTHDSEMRRADPSEQAILEPQHKFEKSYFDYQEAKFKGDSDMVEKKEQAHNDFKNYYADKYGMSPNEQVAAPKAIYTPKISTDIKPNPLVDKYKNAQTHEIAATEKSYPHINPAVLEKSKVTQNIQSIREASNPLVEKYKNASPEAIKKAESELPQIKPLSPEKQAITNNIQAMRAKHGMSR